MQRNDQDLRAQRIRAAWRVRACAAAMAVGAQVFLFGAGLVMPLCLNAAWLAAPAAIPAAALAAAVCRRALGRGGLRRSGAAVRALHMLVCVSFLVCAVFAIVSLVNLAEQSLLPQTRAAHSVAMTVLAVFFCALSGGTGAPRAAFLLRFALPAVLAVLGVRSLLPEDVSGLFPLLGAGTGPLALGALCMTGAAFPALMLLYPPPELEEPGMQGQPADLPDARFFVRRVLTGAAAGAALLFVLILGGTYEGAVQSGSWGERLVLVGSGRPREGVAQTGLTLAQMLAILFLAVNMLLGAQQALGCAFARLNGFAGLALCMIVMLLMISALFFPGFEAALFAVPLLCAALVLALSGAWTLAGKEEKHGA